MDDTLKIEITLDNGELITVTAQDPRQHLAKEIKLHGPVKRIRVSASRPVQLAREEPLFDRLL